jgi:hypothetical protein
VQPDSAAYGAMQTVWNLAVSAGHAASAGGPASVAPGSDVPALSRTLARLHGAYYALRRALVDDARSANVAKVLEQQKKNEGIGKKLPDAGGDCGAGPPVP